MKAGDIVVVKQTYLLALERSWEGMSNYAFCMNYFREQHKIESITTGGVRSASIRSPDNHPYWHGSNWSFPCSQLRVVKSDPVSRVACKCEWAHCSKKLA
jgi:hypothetical protein